MKKLIHKRNLKLGTKINMLVLSIVLLLAVVIGFVVVKEVSDGIKNFAVQKAKGDLNLVYRYINDVYSGDWKIDNDKLLKGSTVLNENYELLDTIGEDTGDTVTVFLGDTRIATNVMQDGKRIVGTQASTEVIQTVINEGKNYYGEALVAGEPYQTAYMPLKDTAGQTIGMLYVGASQEVIQETISEFLRSFLFVLVLVILLASLAVYLFTRNLKKRLSTIASALQDAGQGDFTNEVTDLAGDELSELTNSYNLMKESLSTMVQQVKETSEEVLASSEELMASSEETTAATNQVAKSIQEVSYRVEVQANHTEDSILAIDDMTKGIQQVATSTSSVAEGVAETSKHAKIGYDYVEKVVQQMDLIHKGSMDIKSVMNGLESKSTEIGAIIDVITDIADQTNLLALNAAIESARAGEYGKGFAVVADEVRKLAEQSRDSANQVAEMIKHIQQGTKQAAELTNNENKIVKEGLDLAKETGNIFEQILEQIQYGSNQILEISAISEQLFTNAKQVNSSIEEVGQLAKTTSANTEDIAAASEEQLAAMEEVASSASSLANMADKLKDLVSKFKV